MSLSSATQRTYRSAINKLQTAGQLDFSAVNNSVRLNSTLINYLSTEIVNPASRKVYLSAVLDKIRDWSAADKKPYTEMALSLRKTVEHDALSQKLKEHRAINMLKWNEVLALKNKASSLDPEDYLIYSLYTLNAPVRADYANMLVITYYSKKYKDAIDRNYCVLHDDHGFFVFNVYKTHKTYGQVTVPIHPVLFNMIKSQRTKNTLLLPTVDTNNNLSKRVIAIFYKLSGKKMGIGLLRHSFITSYLSTINRIHDKELISRSMMHSWVMQEAYHIISDDEVSI